MIDFSRADKLKELYEEATKDRDLLIVIVTTFCEHFLRDRLGRPLRLRPSQMDIVLGALTEKRLVVLAPRGSGKSYGIAIAVVIRQFFLRENQETVVVAPSNKQAKRIFQYVEGFFNCHPELKRLVKGTRHANPAMITFHGNSTLSSVAVSKNDHGENVRGMHPTYCIVDESGFIPDDIFVPNVEPIVIANEAAFIHITTPGPRDNHVYRYLFDKKYKRWTRIKQTWRDVLEQGDSYEPTYPIDEATGKNAIELLIEEWGEDSPEFRREYMCEYDADESNLFPSGIFDRCGFDLARFQQSGEGEFNVMTIDYGRKHNSTAWGNWRISTKEEDEDGFNVANLIDLHEIIPRGKGYTPQAIRNDIIEYIRTNHINAVVIDATAFGDSFTQDLKDYLYSNMPGIFVYEFIFSIGKSDWYYKYKYYMNERRVLIPKPSSVLDVTEANLVARAIHQHKILTAEISHRSGKVLIHKPRHEHDDLADAMMLITMFLDKNPKHNIDMDMSSTSNPSRNQPWSTEISTPKRLGDFKMFKDTGMWRS